MPGWHLSTKQACRVKSQYGQLQAKLQRKAQYVQQQTSLHHKITVWSAACRRPSVLIKHSPAQAQLKMSSQDT